LARREQSRKVSKEIIVNVEPRETRVAIVESGRLVELMMEREERVVGSVYKCKVANVLPGMDAAFVDIGLERNAFLYVGDVLPESDQDVPIPKKEQRGMSIADMVKVGQEILVQVVKGPRGTKGARVSTRISLPGRYLVLMPDTEHTGVSRKIEEANERDRLRKIAEQIRPLGFGLIMRTEAEGKGEHELRQDLEFLLRMWNQIQERAKKTHAPGIVYQDLSLIYRTIRDAFGTDVRNMIIDSPIEYEKALEIVDFISPKLRNSIELYDGEEPVFERYSIESELHRLLKRKVWLESGGYVTIDETEALTTIDVNTGKFVGSSSLSETILKTNLDAAEEVCRQLRLRDIGGIIIVDFIDMSSEKDRQTLLHSLERALRRDRTRVKIAHLSPLGLIEITRKRTGETISEATSQACPYCQGRAKIASPETVSIEVERQLDKLVMTADDEAFLVTVHPEVGVYLVGPAGRTIERIEKNLRRAVFVRADPQCHIEEYAVIPGDLQEMEHELVPYRPNQILECTIQKDPFSTLPRSTGWVDGYLVDLANGGQYLGQKVKARITGVHRSYALGEVVSPAHVLDKGEPM
jgi:ribonuclease G